MDRSPPSSKSPSRTPWPQPAESTACQLKSQACCETDGKETPGQRGGGGRQLRGRAGGRLEFPRTGRPSPATHCRSRFPSPGRVVVRCVAPQQRPWGVWVAAQPPASSPPHAACTPLGEAARTPLGEAARKWASPHSPVGADGKGHRLCPHQREERKRRQPEDKRGEAREGEALKGAAALGHAPAQRAERACLPSAERRLPGRPAAREFSISLAQSSSSRAACRQASSSFSPPAYVKRSSTTLRPPDSLSASTGTGFQSSRERKSEPLLRKTRQATAQTPRQSRTPEPRPDAVSEAHAAQDSDTSLTSVPRHRGLLRHHL